MREECCRETDAKGYGGYREMEEREGEIEIETRRGRDRENRDEGDTVRYQEGKG